MAEVKHIIRRPLPGTTVSGLLPAAAAKPRGTAYKLSAKDANTGENTFALADNTVNGFYGFVTRDIRTTPGLTDEEQLMGFGQETPFEAGKPASLEDALEIEVEGADFMKLDAGAGQITAATAAGTKLTFAAGKLQVAVAGDYAHYVLVKQMAPVVAGDVRIYARRLQGELVPA